MCFTSAQMHEPCLPGSFSRSHWKNYILAILVGETFVMSHIVFSCVDTFISVVGY